MLVPDGNKRRPVAYGPTVTPTQSPVPYLGVLSGRRGPHTRSGPSAVPYIAPGYGLHGVPWRMHGRRHASVRLHRDTGSLPLTHDAAQPSWPDALRGCTFSSVLEAAGTWPMYRPSFPRGRSLQYHHWVLCPLISRQRTVGKPHYTPIVALLACS